MVKTIDLIFRKKSVMILFSLLLVVIFSGCVQVTYYQKLHQDGSSDIQIEMDLNKIYLMSSSFNQSMTMADFDAQMEKQVCSNITQENLTAVKCSVKNAKAVMSGKLDKTPGFEKEDGLFETVYNYKIEGIGNTGANELAKNVSMLKAVGAEVKYIVEMPGEVVETNGKVENKSKVEFDLLDVLSKNETPYVKSKETKFVTIIAIVIGIIVIIALALILTKRKQQQ